MWAINWFDIGLFDAISGVVAPMIPGSDWFPLILIVGYTISTSSQLFRMGLRFHKQMMFQSRIRDSAQAGLKALTVQISLRRITYVEQ